MKKLYKKKEEKKANMKFTKCWRRPPAVWTIWVVGRPPALRRLRQHNCPAVVLMMMMMMMMRSMMRMVVLVKVLVLVVVVVACKLRRTSLKKIFIENNI